MEWLIHFKKRKNNMIFNRSTNKIIIRAVAALNKSIKAHAYSAIYSGFKVKSKAQFIANVVSAKINIPGWWSLGKTKAQKTASAHQFWNYKFHSHLGSYHATESSILYVRPTKDKGYGALLSQAEKLGEFSWSQLLLSIPHHAQKIAEAYRYWGKYSGYKKSVYRNGKSKNVYVSFDAYANNYFNSYRAYFVKNRIISKVKGKRGIYTLTPNGKLLLSGMKQLDTMR